MNLPKSVALANARELRDQGVSACKALAQGEVWQIDAVALEQFDSGLLSTLLEWQRAAKAQGVTLRLQGMHSAVAERFKALAVSYDMSEVLPSLS